MLSISIPISLLQFVFLVFVRLLAIALAIPYFRKGAAARSIVLFCGVLAVAITMISNHKDFKYIDSISTIFFGCVLEMIIGAGISLIFYMALEAVMFAGRIIGMQTGMDFASLVDPLTGDQYGTITQLYNLTAALLFFALDGHLLIIKAIVESIELVPPLSFDIRGGAKISLFAMGAKVFSTGLKIAAPVMVALLLSTVSFAVMARLAPQMNIFFVVIPLKIILALMVFLFSLPFLGHVIKKTFTEFLAHIPTFIISLVR